MSVRSRGSHAGNQPCLTHNLKMVRCEPQYEVRPCGGRSLIDYPPLFSNDQSLLFVISGQNIHIYNVTTTEFVKSLKNDGCSKIVAMAFPSDDDRALIVCDKTGKLMTWKWHACVLSSETLIRLPKDSVVMEFKLINNNKAIIAWKTKKTHIGVIDLSTGKVCKELGKFKSIPKTYIAVEVYENRPIVAFTDSESGFRVFDAIDPTLSKTYHIPSKLSITMLTWHPSLEILAVGDSLGRIVLWRNPLRSLNPPKEMCHWHHLPVKSVVFSPRGGLMLSGGMERVVVAWTNSNLKKFLPRLPDTVVHISASYSHFAIATKDNGIQIIDSGSFNPIGCIRETGGSTIAGVGPMLQFVRNAHALLLPANSGHLHMFSTVTNNLLYTLDVTNTNIVPAERDNLEPEQIEINKICVGCRSQWLVTWEGRQEQERVRWWEWSTNEWKLHTVAACPHYPANSIDLKIAEEAAVTVTSDSNNVLRFWRYFDSTPGFDRPAWSINAKSFRNCDNPGGVAVTTDGSLAAAWYGSRLTLWDTAQGVQKESLAHPMLRPQGRLVQFGRDRHMHFVACTTDEALGVWNLMTLRLIWVVKLDTSCLTIDPFSDRVCAVSKTNDIYIFKMNEHDPMKIPNAIPAEEGCITSAAFAPADSNADFKLYFLRNQQEIFVVDRSDVLVESKPILDGIGVQPKMSAYSAMIADKQLNLVKDQYAVHRPQASNKGVMNELLLSSAAHTQPKLTNLCGTILRALSRINIAEPATEVDAKTETTADDVEPSVQIKRSNSKTLLKQSMSWVEDIL